MSQASFSGKSDPVVRQLKIGDIIDCLALGLRDFQKAPRIGLMLGGLCAAIGIVVVGLLFAAGLPYLAYPLGAGFALVGPFLAAGTYEVSRRLETGEPITFGDVWRRVASRSEIRWLGFMTLFVMIMWMYQVRFLMALFLGYSGVSASLADFIKVITTTNEGMMFLLTGNLVGAALACILFSLSVVSFPLALDRDVDFVTAMITSVRAVAASPAAMLFWGIIVAVILALSALPAFLGLIISLPVLGHATWHVYRRAVA